MVKLREVILLTLFLPIVYGCLPDTVTNDLSGTNQAAGPIPNLRVPNNIQKIFLHWSADATQCSQAAKTRYHVSIERNGRINYTNPLYQKVSHIYRRNDNSIGLSVCCMGSGGGQGTWTNQCTTAQLNNLALVAAQIATARGWTPEDITIQRVMTHAEAASNKDIIVPPNAIPGWLQNLLGGIVGSINPLLGAGFTYLADRLPNNPAVSGAVSNLVSQFSRSAPHDNYGPANHCQPWQKGTAERWDLHQLRQNDPPGNGRRAITDKNQSNHGSEPEPHKDQATLWSNLGQ